MSFPSSPGWRRSSICRGCSSTMPRVRSGLELGGDLLVDLALGEAAEHVQLARRERAGPADAALGAVALRKLVDDPADLGLAEPAGLAGLDASAPGSPASPRGRRRSCRRGGSSPRALGLLGVVALDGLGDPGVDAPAPGQHPADEGVVDAQLAALGGDAVVGGAAVAVEALGVARVQAGQHRAADVVKDRGERELVAIAVADASATRSEARWTARAWRRKRSGRERQLAGAVEEVVGWGRSAGSPRRRRGRGARRRRGRCGCGRRPGSARRRGRSRRSGRRRSRPRAATSCGGAPRATSSRAWSRDSVRRGLALGLVEGGGEYAAAALAARAGCWAARVDAAVAMPYPSAAQSRLFSPMRRASNVSALERPLDALPGSAPCRARRATRRCPGRPCRPRSPPGSAGRACPASRRARSRIGASAASICVGLEGLDARAAPRSDVLQQRHGAVLHRPSSRPSRRVSGSSKRKPISGQTSSRVCAFSWAIAQAARRARRARGRGAAAPPRVYSSSGSSRMKRPFSQRSFCSSKIARRPSPRARPRSARPAPRCS